MINLTPHAIVIITTDGEHHWYSPSGTVARVETIEVACGDFNGVPVVSRTFGEVTGLPPEGTPCLVSAIVLGACPGRPNTFAPDTGSTAIRDAEGKILGVTRLVKA